MNGWCIFGLILLALILLGQLPVGVRGTYSAEGLRVWARVGPIRIRVYPFRLKKEVRAKKKKPSKEKKDKLVSPSKGGGLQIAKQMLPLVLEAAGQFRKKLRVETLYLDVTAGAPNPADAAMIYGRTNAALGAVWQALVEAFRVKDGRAHVDIDFESDRTTLHGVVSLSVKIGQMLWLCLYFGIRAIHTMTNLRRTQKQKTQQRKAV